MYSFNNIKKNSSNLIIIKNIIITIDIVIYVIVFLLEHDEITKQNKKNYLIQNL